MMRISKGIRGAAWALVSLGLASLSPAQAASPTDADPAAGKNTYAQMCSASGLKDVALYADGLGPEKTQIVPQDAETLLPATSLVKDAHAAGLVVHPWTVRAENYFLPASLRKGDAQSPTYLATQGDVTPVFKALYAAGVDGIFSDFPGLAVAARG